MSTNQGPKVISLAGEAMVKLPGGEKKVNYVYPKIITPATKRNSGTEAEQKEARFYTFAEMAAFLGGNVEFKTIAKEVDGKKVLELDPDAPTCIVQYVIDGWNIEQNRLAKEAKVNTPSVELAKQRILLVEMRAKQVKLSMDVSSFDTMIASIDAKIKALDTDETEIEEETEAADKKEAAETRQGRAPKTAKK
jgi:hypothetical protein